MSAPWTAAAPAHWRRGRVKDLVGTCRNGVWGDEPTGADDVAVVRAADFDRDGLRVSRDRLPLRTVDPRQVRVHLLRSGDLVLEKSGGGEGQPVGTAVTFDLDVPAVASNFNARLTPAPGCDPAYVKYVLAAFRWAGVTQRSIKQTTGLQNLDVGALFAEPWAVPPAAEQRAIVRDLEERLVRQGESYATLQELRLKLLERRAAVVYRAVTGADAAAYAPADVGWCPEVPAGWNTVKLTHVARLGSGHTPSRSRPDWWTDCRIPWITTGEVQQVRDDRREEITETRECISALGLANSSAALHPRGTVVLSRTASVGFSAVMGTDMATSQDFATWTCGPRVDPFYLLYCLRAMRPYLLGYLAQGSTHKTIYMPDIEALRIPLPPVEEQREIVGRIREQVGVIDELVDAADGQLRLLEERRRALITAAVTGQMDLMGEAA